MADPKKKQDQVTEPTNAPAPEKEVVAGKDIGRAPNGAKFAAANPGENMIVFVPGKNWKTGEILTGRYVGTERVYSDKFTAGKKDVQGKIYRDLHTLEDMNDKSLLGIWSVGILGNFFAQVPSEAPVSITYKGLGDAPLKPGQSVPHTFDFALGEGYRLQRGGAVAEAQQNAQQ